MTSMTKKMNFKLHLILTNLNLSGHGELQNSFSGSCFHDFMNGESSA